MVKKVFPEIYPDKPVIAIETNGKFPIECKTKGSKGGSLLTWYRILKNGTKVKVNVSRIKSSDAEQGGNYIDIERLTFIHFTSKDVGEYICERKVGQSVTSKSVNVQLKRRCFIYFLCLFFGDKLPLLSTCFYFCFCLICLLLNCGLIVHVCGSSQCVVMPFR